MSEVASLPQGLKVLDCGELGVFKGLSDFLVWLIVAR